MTDQQWMLRNFTPFETDSSWINGIGWPQTAVLGKENIHIVTPVNDVSKKCTISDVLYTPSIGINLFAVGFFIAEGSEVHFTESREFIERNGALEMTATRIDNKLYIPSRYHCSSRQWNIYCLSISEISSGMALIHSSIGHISYRKIMAKRWPIKRMCPWTANRISTPNHTLPRLRPGHLPNISYNT
jgi:hypothetical protein